MSSEAQDRVREVWDRVPREAFLPRRHRAHAGADQPWEIGWGATNSQPSTVRDMLTWLDVREGQRVLDIGAGSGWTTALLAALTGPDGEVLGLEIETGLAAWGAGNVAAWFAAAWPGRTPWASVEPAAHDVLGAPERGPWDRILVSAMAKDLPEDLVAQLAPEGILVLPCRGRMSVVRRTTAGRIEREEHGHYLFVPLR